MWNRSKFKLGEVVQEQLNYIVKDLSRPLKDPFEISEDQIKEEAPSFNFTIT
jgi:hypothetical protein